MSPRWIIDPGHGGRQPAGNSTPLGVRGPSGLLEKDVVLDLARRVQARLGGQAQLTRSQDVNLSLGQRCAVARQQSAEAFVSIHANAGPAGRRGAEVFAHAHASGASRDLARSMTRELAAFGGPVLGNRAAELAVLTPDWHAPKTAACLIEVDYLSDGVGEERLRNPRSLDSLASAIARGVRGRYGGGITVTNQPPPHRTRAPASDVNNRAPFRLVQQYVPDNEIGFEFAAIGVEPSDPVNFQGPVRAEVVVVISDTSNQELARGSVTIVDDARGYVTFTGPSDPPMPTSINYEVTVYNRYRSEQGLDLRMWTYTYAE